MATVNKSPRKSTGKTRQAVPIPLLLTRAERLAAGKALRDGVPRTSHADWKPSKKRRDAIDILEASNKDRLPQLVPIRYGRMLASPFTFLRGRGPSPERCRWRTASVVGPRRRAGPDCHSGSSRHRVPAPRERLP